MHSMRATTRFVAPQSRPSVGRALPRPAFTATRSAQTSHSPNPHAPKASPGSDSPEEAGVKGSRSTDQPGVGSTGGSTAKPVSQEDRAMTSEEGEDPAKRDPNAPTEEKRKSIEREGQKPLDPADK